MLQTLILDGDICILDKLISSEGNYITSGIIHTSDKRKIEFHTVNRIYEPEQDINVSKPYEGNLEHPTRKVKSNSMYLNKREMLEEIQKYHETKEISERLANMFRIIAKKFSSHSWFYRYTYREDMMSQAVFMMLKKIDKFDLNYPSADPFAYFSSVAYNEFRQMIKKENKNLLARENFRQHVWTDICTEENLQVEDDSEKMNDYVKHDEPTATTIED